MWSTVRIGLLVCMMVRSVFRLFVCLLDVLVVRLFA